MSSGPRTSAGRVGLICWIVCCANAYEEKADRAAASKTVLFMAHLGRKTERLHITKQAGCHCFSPMFTIGSQLAESKCPILTRNLLHQACTLIDTVMTVGGREKYSIVPLNSSSSYWLACTAVTAM